ncbi:hypothetical protein F5882DRAFT_388870 [Hyaloscypha sp. PMI_1271]|nr:hypothetical protein F5882DRAFT_388870 [Hyaloscypha sp. PMI_1271]
MLLAFCSQHGSEVYFLAAFLCRYMRTLSSTNAVIQYPLLAYQIFSNLHHNSTQNLPHLILQDACLISPRCPRCCRNHRTKRYILEAMVSSSSKTTNLTFTTSSSVKPTTSTVATASKAATVATPTPSATPKTTSGVRSDERPRDEQVRCCSCCSCYSLRASSCLPIRSLRVWGGGICGPDRAGSVPKNGIQGRCSFVAAGI